MTSPTSDALSAASLPAATDSSRFFGGFWLPGGRTSWSSTFLMVISPSLPVVPSLLRSIGWL